MTGAPPPPRDETRETLAQRIWQDCLLVQVDALLLDDARDPDNTFRPGLRVLRRLIQLGPP